MSATNYDNVFVVFTSSCSQAATVVSSLPTSWVGATTWDVWSVGNTVFAGIVTSNNSPTTAQLAGYLSGLPETCSVIKSEAQFGGSKVTP